MPEADTDMWKTSWNVTEEPSEPVPCTTRMPVAAKFRRLKFWPSQFVNRPLKLTPSLPIKINVPVAVKVNQPVPAPTPEVRNVECATPLYVSVRVPGTP